MYQSYRDRFPQFEVARTERTSDRAAHEAIELPYWVYRDGQQASCRCKWCRYLRDGIIQPGLSYDD